MAYGNEPLEALIPRLKRMDRLAQTTVGKTGKVLLIVGLIAIFPLLPISLLISSRFDGLGRISSLLILLPYVCFSLPLLYFVFILLPFALTRNRLKRRVHSRIAEAVDLTGLFKEKGALVSLRFNDNCDDAPNIDDLFKPFMATRAKITGCNSIRGVYRDHSLRSVSCEIYATEKRGNRNARIIDLYKGRITRLQSKPRGRGGRLLVIPSVVHDDPGLTVEGFNAMLNSKAYERVSALCADWKVYADRNSAEAAQRFLSPDTAFYRALSGRPKIDFIFIDADGQIIFGSQNDLVFTGDSLEEMKAACETSARAFLEDIDALLAIEAEI